jgi:superfamily II DNA or RNA helicase
VTIHGPETTDPDEMLEGDDPQETLAVDGDDGDEHESDHSADDDDDTLPEIPRADDNSQREPPPPLPLTPATAVLVRMSERSLSRTVGMNAYQKGRGYARRGNVFDADVTNWMCFGRVHGRAVSPYDVKVDLQESGAFQSLCSCPAWRGPERHCKHVAALLVHLRDRLKHVREQVIAQTPVTPPHREEERRGNKPRKKHRHEESSSHSPREVVVVDRAGPRVVSTHTGTAAATQSAGANIMPVELRTGWQTWLPTGDPKRAPDFEYRIQFRTMALGITAYTADTRTVMGPEQALDALGPFVSAHRPLLRTLARQTRGSRQPTVEARGEDAAEILSLLRGRRALIEPTLMELRFVDDPLVPKMELELVASSSVRVRVVFERKSDNRRYNMSQGLWLEGQPGWHIETTQGLARPIAENVTPAWLERLSRAPSVTHPLEDLGRLLTEIIPKTAFALGTELPDLESVVELVDATPTFTLRADGDLTVVRATLRAVYGDVELDVAPAELPNPLAIGASTGDRPRVIRRDIGAERMAADTLFNLGLGLPEEHANWFEAHGDKATTFWTEGLGSLPDDWDRYIPDDLINVTVRDTPVTPRARVSSGVDWLALDVEFESEGCKVNEDDLRRAILEGRRLVRLEDGTFAPVSKEKVEEVLSRMAEIFAMGRKQLPLSQAGRIQDLLRLLPGARVEPQARDLIASLAERKLELEPVPKLVQATMRPYQIEGFSWLVFLHKAKTGGVLADDMGLGKTLQTLSLLTWAREEAQRSPEKTETVRVIETVADSKVSVEKNSGVRLTQRTSPTAAVIPQDRARRTVEEPKPVAVAAKKVVKKKTTEEASKVEAEAPKAKKTKKVEEAVPFKAPLSLVVAPTSVVLNWLREIQRFAPHLKAVAWTGPDREKRTHEVDGADVLITSYALLRRDEDFLQRYDFAYVILDEAQNIKNPLSATARTAKKLSAKRRLALTGTPIENRLSEIWSIFDFLSPGMLGDLATFEERYARPIDRGDTEAIRRLRAVIHPLVMRRTKVEVAKDLPERIVVERECDLPNAQRSLYGQVLAQVRASILGEIDRVGISRSQIAILAGLTRLRQAACDPRLLKLPGDYNDDDSGKLESLREIVAEAIQSGHRTLVFSQFVEMLTLIRRALEKDGVRYEYLDGSTKDRMERVDRFNGDENIPVFLISLKAGGSGLNLTGADTVIHFDPWWNPAVEDQATDRAHRIGQTRVVTAYRLIARGTIEEKIMALSAKKRELVSSVLGADEETLASKSFTRADVEALLSDDGEA